ncbi:helix-turn-helix transcriptional regulator [Thermaurantiacus sp.]
MGDAPDRFILACAQAALDVPLARYMDWAFDALSGLVRFEAAGWGIGTHTPPVTHFVHLLGVPPELLLAYEAGVAEIDYIRQASAARPGVTINDFDIRDSFPDAAAEIDARISAPFALAQTLATTLPAEAGLVHFILLWRRTRFDPFSEADRQLAERLKPHMVAGWRVAQRLHLMQRAAGGDLGHHALVDRLGALHSFDNGFVRLVRRAFPDWGGGRLPDALGTLLPKGGTVPGLSLGVERSGALLALTVRAQRPDPLTPAERAAAELYAAGLGYRAVAERLERAPGTVRNQIARAYKRLGVNTKVALAERLAKLS